MPHNTNKTTDELVSTSYLQPVKLKSPLQDISRLDQVFLSEVTDEELDNYEEEYMNYRNDVYNPSMSNINKLEDIVQKSINNVFGSYSKEAKYIKRAFSGGGIRVQMHFSLLSKPRDVRIAVREARELQTNTSNVSLSDNDISQIDLAIKYLIQQGFKYGEDFTSNNAVNIAKSEIINEVSTKGNFNDHNVVKFHDECSDTCRANEYTLTVNQESIERECSCGMISENANFELSLNGSDNVTLNIQGDNE